MNTNSRYILTATAVGAGLLVVGAGANAISSENGASANEVLGDPVVVPSTSATPADTPDAPVVTETPEVVDLEPEDLVIGGLDDGGWGFDTTSPPPDDDDDDDHDEDEEDEEDEDDEDEDDD